MDFDVIPFEDIVWGHRLGAGSFGSVYKGSYLGIDIAIKEVLPSNEYDVHKYFEREWRIMRECRHPNIVLFLGLSKAPDDDGRVFIISEYVPRGNLRQYILSSNPFPWRLRLSFATDVARAVAYLHARQCIHRDLKGENLLLTSNERVKVTDFGFARIASRNAEEMRRMTYCGTDGYMSPEIINGLEFDLPTDVFSLGIIFIEIMSRRLVDSKTYVRPAPSFTPDPGEVRRLASPGCPPALIELALTCCLERPDERPLMHEVLSKLREIELEILARNDENPEHVGSIRLIPHRGKRAMPVFDGGARTEEGAPKVDEEENQVRKMEEEALVTLAGLDVGGAGASVIDSEGGTWRTAQWDDRVMSGFSDASDLKGHQPLLPTSSTDSSLVSNSSSASTYSTDVIRGKPVQSASAFHTATPFHTNDKAEEGDTTGSTMTVKAVALGTGHVDPAPSEEDVHHESSDGLPNPNAQGDMESKGEEVIPPASQIESIPSLASSELLGKTVISGGEKGGLGTHRFTLVDKDAIPLINGKKVSAFTSNFAFAFLQKSLAPTTKCVVCHKKLGGRPALQCDDCDALVHVNCSHAAPRDCTGGVGIGKTT